MIKQPPPAADPQRPESFEAAMRRLDQIVEEMENADLPLEQIVQRFEEGTRLRQYCEEQLREADRRVALLTANAAGDPETAPFDPDTGPGDDPGTTPPAAPSRRRARPSNPASPGPGDGTEDQGDDLLL